MGGDSLMAEERTTGANGVFIKSSLEVKHSTINRYFAFGVN
jgi:hypothetical protein